MTAHPVCNVHAKRLKKQFYGIYFPAGRSTGSTGETEVHRKGTSQALCEKYDFHSVLEGLIQNGKTVVLSTQAIYEGSDITVYRSGHVAKAEFGLMESYDMTLEATVTKLMWILGQTKQPAEIRRLFNTTIANDMLSQEWDWEEL